MGIEVRDLERIEQEITDCRDQDKIYYFVGESDDLPGLTFFACVAHTTIIKIDSDGEKSETLQRNITDSLSSMKNCKQVIHHVGVVDRSLFPFEMVVQGEAKPGAIVFGYEDKPAFEQQNKYFQKISLGSFGQAAKRRCFEAQFGVTLQGECMVPETIKGRFSFESFLGSSPSDIYFDLTLLV